MISRKFLIRNEDGLHLRPAGKLSGLALNYHCRITFQYADGEGNGDAKSVLSILAAGVRCGDEIELTFDGPDEEAVMKAIGELIEENFEE